MRHCSRACTTIAPNLFRLRRFFSRSRGHLHPIVRKTGTQWGPRRLRSMKFVVLVAALQSCAVFLLLTGSILAQEPAPAAQSPAPSSAPPAVTASAPFGEITGTVKSGNVSLPGVTVTAANTLTGKKYVTSSDVDGTFKIEVGAKGRYVVRAEFSAFAPITQEIVINAENRNGRADLAMVLMSRAQKEEQQQQQQQQQRQQQLAAGGRLCHGFYDGWPWRLWRRTQYAQLRYQQTAWIDFL